MTLRAQLQRREDEEQHGTDFAKEHEAVRPSSILSLEAVRPRSTFC